MPNSGPTDLDAIAFTVAQQAEARERLRLAVAKARANGRTWTEIGMILRTSKQAARERFTRKAR